MLLAILFRIFLIRIVYSTRKQVQYRKIRNKIRNFTVRHLSFYVATHGLIFPRTKPRTNPEMVYFYSEKLAQGIDIIFYSESFINNYQKNLLSKNIN